MTPVKLVRIRGAMLISLSMSTCTGTEAEATHESHARLGSQQRAGAQLYLQVGREGVREPHVPREGTQDEIAKLDAVGRDNVTEAVMVVTQELWEIMQQDQQHPERALKKPRRRRR